jgi:ABC-type proline/glycine betaine transport system substrate-binding protein
MGANGTTPGAAIRKVPMSLLDAQRPNWHADPQSATIKEFMYDSRTPLVFYVYPPATANTQVELVYAKPPTNVAAAANVINIDDGYANALLDYMLYRAYSKDTEDSNNEARAAAAYAAFKEGLGFKAQSDATAVAAAGVRK